MESTSVSLDIRPMTAKIGAEIVGLDLAQDLDEGTVRAIRRALLDWKVVFFREQSLDHGAHVAFGRRFGELTPGHPYADSPEGFPEILPVDYQEHNRAGEGIQYDSRYWHTDITPAVNPPAASILRADRVPTYGGDTCWTNLVAAYEGLPQSLRSLVDSLRAVHRYQTAFAVQDGLRERTASNPLIAEHPVVRVHPETGERALFVNPLFTRHIVGYPPDLSRRILDLLFEHISKVKYTVRFRWQPGSIAFWDNRATAHILPDDIEQLDVERRLFRVTLVGDVPVGPDGRPSATLRGSLLDSAR